MQTAVGFRLHALPAMLTDGRTDGQTALNKASTWVQVVFCGWVCARVRRMQRMCIFCVGEQLISALVLGSSRKKSNLAVHHTDDDDAPECLALC